MSYAGFPGGFGILFVVMSVVFLLFWVGVRCLDRHGGGAQSAGTQGRGLDPLAAQSQLAVRASRSGVMAPRKSVEDPLAELEDLHRRGVISAEEYATARAAALAEG